MSATLRTFIGPVNHSRLRFGRDPFDGVHRMKLLGLKCFVDGDRGLDAFGGGNHDELGVTRCVAGDEHARNVGVAERSGFHRSFLRERASESDRQLGLRMLAGCEKNGFARQRLAGFEDHPG